MEFVDRWRSGRDGRYSIAPYLMRALPMRTSAIFVVLFFAVLTADMPAQTASGYIAWADHGPVRCRYSQGDGGCDHCGWKIGHRSHESARNL